MERMKKKQNITHTWKMAARGARGEGGGDGARVGGGFEIYSGYG